MEPLTSEDQARSRRQLELIVSAERVSVVRCRWHGRPVLVLTVPFGSVDGWEQVQPVAVLLDDKMAAELERPAWLASELLTAEVADRENEGKEPHPGREGDQDG